MNIVTSQQGVQGDGVPLPERDGKRAWGAHSPRSLPFFSFPAAGGWEKHLNSY